MVVRGVKHRVRGNLVHFGRIAMAIVAGFGAVGCVGWQAYRCPEVAERNVAINVGTIESLRKVRVIVRSERNSDQTSILATCMRKTGVFGDVVEDESDRDVQLAVRIVKAPSIEALPLLPAATFGILPQ